MPRRPNIRPEDPGRERVLSAALELFGERGYDGTSIADIGVRAGIAKSVLYHYFGSKATLYEAVMEAETRDLLERVAACVPEASDAPRLRAGVEAYLTFLRGRPASWRLFLRDAPADPHLREVWERCAGQRTAGLTTLLTTSSKRRVSPAHIGLVATGIRAFAGWWYEHRETIPQAAITDAILDFAAASTRHLPNPGTGS